MRGRMSDAPVVRRPGRGRRRDRRRHGLRGRGVAATRRTTPATWCCPTPAGRRHAISRRPRPAQARPVRRTRSPPRSACSACPGFTAYAGLLEIGRPQPGETVVVAAATGPVGLGRRPDREGQGRPRRRHRRRRGEAAGAARRVRLRRRARPPLPHVRRRPGGGGARRDRRLLRERGRPGRARGVQADEPLRAGPGVRAGGRLQRHVGARRVRTGCRAS